MMAHDNVKLTYGHMGDTSFWVGPAYDKAPVAYVPWDRHPAARDNARDNAARLCLTWNAHDDLVAALKEIELICTESAGDCRRRMGTRVGNALATATAALAKAGAA